MKKNIILALLAFSSSAFASDAQQLKVELSALENFSAHFSQEVKDINGATLQRASGQLALKQPNLLYWHTKQPDEHLMVADGKALWLVNPFIEQVSVFDQALATKQSPVALLVQKDEAAWRDFNISAQNDCFTIEAKSLSDSLVNQVTICFEGKTLNSLTIKDSQFNTSIFTLNGHKALTELDDKLFQYTPSAGFDIDDQR